MNELLGYVFSPLREGVISLYRGSGDGLAPILLVAAEESSPERLEHEYALKSDVGCEWAARPLALTHHNGRMTLVLEDPGGAPLDRVLGRSLEVSHFLRIAIPLAGALRQMHERGLIHKDIKPANILVDSASGHVWLMGFGIASRLPREHQAPAPPQVIAGTLAYMAPEQTGRMNRSVDSRSDLYALGVTFYEMLTGQLPFTATDPMEWVHCHIAGPATSALQFTFGTASQRSLVSPRSTCSDPNTTPSVLPRAQPNSPSFEHAGDLPAARRTSESGQSRRFGHVRVTFRSTPVATELRTSRISSFVPYADQCSAAQRRFQFSPEAKSPARRP